ncbi:hypothetical protein BJ875DRAFT_386250 [Amylocarpus encephaloides]|uniref:Uncharacterized protein n=1 Tax=Amylocarpus encephaloides TaxID=45428 RepID=A0A9P7YA61_9HELO|nr:hypothetical protein BJ875DRAFT_386250 [Amylocarpus encephaloides]
MASEFERELTQLSHKVTNERESSQFWQQKHTTLHQTYLQTDTSLRVLRSELANIQSFQAVNLEKDREVKSKLANVMIDRDAFREAYNEAMGELREKEEEVEMLRGQVRGLKSWVSKGGRGGEEQVSDEGVGEGWGKLGNSLQNWVIVNFRRAKVDTDKAEPELKEQLQRLLPSYEILASSSKIHFIQSLISRLLVNRIFSSYFVGIPSEQAEELEKVERYLGEFRPEENMNQWRSTTISLLRKEAPTKLLAETQTIVDSMTATITTMLSSVTDIAPSEPRDMTLRALVFSSIDLSRLLRAQRAIFRVQMPTITEHQFTIFDGEEMEDVGGEDEEELSGREIRCVVFPGVIKWGDENGERGYLKNVVAKAKVLCAPE